jgi:hypothetical protein
MQERAVWATNIRYMNDAREFNHAKELLKKALDHCKPHVQQKFKELGLEQTVEPDFYPNIFVFSLSKPKDKLSLWRAYGSAGAGYSIGFRTTDLQRVVGIELKKCCYDHHEHKELLLECINLTLQNRKPAHSTMLRLEFWKRFTEVAACVKDQSFREEYGWRLIVEQRNGIKFRAGRSTLTPYIKVRVADNDSVLPIQEIVVGPCTDKPRAVNAVQQLLKSHGQTDVAVVHSDIPYRTW